MYQTKQPLQDLASLGSTENVREWRERSDEHTNVILSYEIRYTVDQLSKSSQEMPKKVK